MAFLSRAAFLSSTFLAIATAYSGEIATLQLRLLTPLNSFQTSAGTVFETVLIAPCSINERVLLPAGTIVYGFVKRRTQVGIGFLHERAGLDLEFHEYQLADGRRFLMEGRLRAIDNARETVDDHGHIRGVVAANNPQHWLDGIWRRPSMSLFQHSLLGLTGMSGRIFTGFEMGPLGGAALIILRICMFSLPEPEIRLPPGTEMKVSLMKLPEGAPRFTSPKPSALPRDLRSWFEEQNFEVNRPGGRVSQDIINIGFIGSRDQLLRAMQAAGWTEAKPRNMRSLSRAWHAYASQTGYADAPASRLQYEGADPEYIFQKSLNTIAMRHHVRIWQSDAAGQQIWLGAATHDVAIKFDSMDGGFSHQIDRHIDLERSKMINDLSFADCTSSTAFVDRRAAVRSGVNRKGVLSDGRIAVATLQNCQATAQILAPDTKPARSIWVRTVRRVILETRQYILRENPYYWGFRAWQWNHSRTQDPTVSD